MHDDDPFAPAAKKPVPLQAQLENASIEELETWIERLSDDIDRVDPLSCENVRV